MLFRPKPKDVDPRERALWGDLTSLGLVFPIAIATGWFVGRWVGTKLGHPMAGQLIGLGWGVAAGFWELYKTTQRLDRYDAAQRKDAEGDGGRDPHGPPADGPGGEGGHGA